MQETRKRNPPEGNDATKKANDKLDSRITKIVQRVLPSLLQEVDKKYDQRHEEDRAVKVKLKSLKNGSK